MPQPRESSEMTRYIASIDLSDDVLTETRAIVVLHLCGYILTDDKTGCFGIPSILWFLQITMAVAGVSIGNFFISTKDKQLVLIYLSMIVVFPSH